MTGGSDSVYLNPKPVGYTADGSVTFSLADRVNAHTSGAVTPTDPGQTGVSEQATTPATGIDVTDEEADVSRCVVAFDRDHTVAVGNLSAREDCELVPLNWVRHLAHETPQLVYATGNQSLVREAEIPGISTIVEQHPRGEEVAAADSPRLSAYGPSRETRVEMLATVHDADRYIVVDDIDLSQIEAFDHYTAWDFMSAVREGDVLPDVSFPEPESDSDSPVDAVPGDR